MVSSLECKGEILIVDDDPTNIGLLFNMLTTENYAVRVANSGRLALAAVGSSVPDLILLDINMPNMSGYEVCQRIKADPDTRELPVIFISASDDTIDKVKAFSMGGVDYVTKPFQTEEVLARIESQLKIARLSRELQMQVLRYQLDPHFLFNALNSVRTLISVDGQTAEEMLMQLADYLRYMLINRERMELPIYEELNAARSYIEIEKVRFRGKLIFITDVDPSLESYLIPASLLQPLLENAIKYGMKSNSQLEIVVSIQKVDDKICLTISNTGKWLSPTENEHSGFGVGLTNIRQRLKQHYPGRHSLTITNDHERVKLKIELPVSFK